MKTLDDLMRFVLWFFVWFAIGAALVLLALLEACDGSRITKETIADGGACTTMIVVHVNSDATVLEPDTLDYTCPPVMCEPCPIMFADAGPDASLPDAADDDSGGNTIWCVGHDMLAVQCLYPQFGITPQQADIFNEDWVGFYGWVEPNRWRDSARCFGFDMTFSSTIPYCLGVPHK